MLPPVVLVEQPQINISTATALATDLPYPLIQTLRCPEIAELMA